MREILWKGQYTASTAYCSREVRDVLFADAYIWKGTCYFTMMMMTMQTPCM